MKFWKQLTYTLLNKKTEEQKMKEKIRLINELLALVEKPIAHEPNQFAKNVATDFYLESIAVSRRDGSVLMNTDKTDALEKMIKATSMYEYVNSEFPDTKMMIIKDKNKYNILYKDKELMYLFRTTGEITSMEAKHIAKELNKAVSQYSLK